MLSKQDVAAIATGDLLEIAFTGSRTFLHGRVTAVRWVCAEDYDGVSTAYIGVARDNGGTLWGCLSEGAAVTRTPAATPHRYDLEALLTTWSVV